MVRVLHLKLENMEICQKAQLKVEQVGEKVNVLALKLVEIEAKVGEK